MSPSLTHYCSLLALALRCFGCASIPAKPDLFKPVVDQPLHLLLCRSWGEGLDTHRSVFTSEADADRSRRTIPNHCPSEEPIINHNGRFPKNRDDFLLRHALFNAL